MTQILTVLFVAIAIGFGVQSSKELGGALPEEVWKFLVYSPCFTAGLMLSRRDFPRSVATTLFVAGAALVAAHCLLAKVGTEHAGFCLIYTAIVSRVLDPADPISIRLSGWRLVWLGERSYSLFLTHCSVIVLVFDVIAAFVPKGTAFLVLSRAVAIPSCALVAMLLFSLVERRFARGLVTGDVFWPVLRKKPRFSEEAIVASSGT